MRMFIRLQSRQKPKFGLQGENEKEDLFSQKENSESINDFDDNIMRKREYFVYVDENHENL